LVTIHQELEAQDVKPQPSYIIIADTATHACTVALREGHVLHVSPEKDVEGIAHNEMEPMVVSSKTFATIRAINQFGAISCLVSHTG
jgi:hypothetical protein